MNANTELLNDALDEVFEETDPEDYNETEIEELETEIEELETENSLRSRSHRDQSRLRDRKIRSRRPDSGEDPGGVHCPVESLTSVGVEFFVSSYYVC
ncbi:hypothetical protein AVEN_263069-1 [Araneus ventricosus]|uniref:Uncharacterized protein n=1 Tax=Araneus ventricosus TaxID=182803 RepID=A0A4Y2MUD5_ARAVE|nr:hypothetical protein AVEN_263069-1 [Araneus ventricosus]